MQCDGHFIGKLREIAVVGMELTTCSALHDIILSDNCGKLQYVSKVQ